MREFNPITASQFETTERYYELPKVLFENEAYQEMRLDVKVAYAILKDRLKLSMKNNWIDEEGLYYLVYSNSKLMSILGCSKSTLLKIKKQLAEYGLMREVQQSTSTDGNLANRIYIGNIDVDTTPVLNLDQGGVKKTLGGYKSDTPPVSKTDPNEPNSSDPESSESSESSSRKQDPSPNPTKYISKGNYALLENISDRYRGATFYHLTHEQKMKIGGYLERGYIFSDDIVLMIDYIDDSVEKPLAYLLTRLSNLEEERRLEAKARAHQQAAEHYR